MAAARGADESLLARVEQVRGWVRGLRLQHSQIDGKGFAGGRSYWLSDPSFPTRQIAMEFAMFFGRGPTETTIVTL